VSCFPLLSPAAAVAAAVASPLLQFVVLRHLLLLLLPLLGLSAAVLAVKVWQLPP
jgi:hypothetical protein